MTTASSYDVIKKALQTDADYAWSWHCNIAMAAVDEGVDHATANRIANRFMQICWQVDTKEPQPKQKAA